MATLRPFRNLRFGVAVLFALIGGVIVGGLSSAHGAKAEPVNVRTGVNCIPSITSQFLDPLLSNCSDQQLNALVEVGVPDEFEVVVEEDASVEMCRADMQRRPFAVDRGGSVFAGSLVTLVSLGIVSAPLLV